MPNPNETPATPPSPAPATRANAPRPAAPLPVTINGKPYFHDGDPAMPLLWFLRDTLRLTGAKYGCGNGQCGACTVLVDGKPARACSVAMKDATHHAVTTIEGLEGDSLHPVQQAWIEIDAMQCGYCQSGQIMGAVALLRATPRPSDAQIDAAMSAHLCRCGTQHRVRAAIHQAAIHQAAGHPAAGGTTP